MLLFKVFLMEKSDNITTQPRLPFEITLHILGNIPVSSLNQFLSINKEYLKNIVIHILLNNPQKQYSKLIKFALLYLMQNDDLLLSSKFLLKDKLQKIICSEQLDFDTIILSMTCLYFVTENSSEKQSLAIRLFSLEQSDPYRLVSHCLTWLGFSIFDKEADFLFRKSEPSRLIPLIEGLTKKQRTNYFIKCLVKYNKLTMPILLIEYPFSLSNNYIFKQLIKLAVQKENNTHRDSIFIALRYLIKNSPNLPKDLFIAIEKGLNDESMTVSQHALRVATKIIKHHPKLAKKTWNLIHSSVFEHFKKIATTQIDEIKDNNNHLIIFKENYNYKIFMTEKILLVNYFPLTDNFFNKKTQEVTILDPEINDQFKTKRILARQAIFTAIEENNDLAENYWSIINALIKKTDILYCQLITLANALSFIKLRPSYLNKLWSLLRELITSSNTSLLNTTILAARKTIKLDNSFITEFFDFIAAGYKNSLMDSKLLSNAVTTLIKIDASFAKQCWDLVKTRAFNDNHYSCFIHLKTIALLVLAQPNLKEECLPLITEATKNLEFSNLAESLTVIKYRIIFKLEQTNAYWDFIIKGLTDNNHKNHVAALQISLELLKTDKTYQKGTFNLVHRSRKYFHSDKSISIFAIRHIETDYLNQVYCSQFKENFKNIIEKSNQFLEICDSHSDLYLYIKNLDKFVTDYLLLMPTSEIPIELTALHYLSTSSAQSITETELRNVATQIEKQYKNIANSLNATANLIELLKTNTILNSFINNNEWRYIDGTYYNGYINLQGLDFSRFCLTNINLTNSNLNNAVFQDANCSNAIFDFSNLDNCNFSGTIISSASFEKTINIESAKLKTLAELKQQIEKTSTLSNLETIKNKNKKGFLALHQNKVTGFFNTATTSLNEFKHFIKQKHEQLALELTQTSLANKIN